MMASRSVHVPDSHRGIRIPGMGIEEELKHIIHGAGGLSASGSSQFGTPHPPTPNLCACPSHKNEISVRC